MAVLSVNVNKVATLRNARGGNRPDVLVFTQDAIRYGAQGITVHPRPDERHIKKQDVYDIAKAIDVEFNIEGYPSADFINMINEVRPAQCTLVPDAPDVVTSNAGWNVHQNQDLLTECVRDLKKSGCRVSLFFDPKDYKDEEFRLIKEKIGADRIELYTEAYAKAYNTTEENRVTELYRKAAAEAHYAGLKVNAGHDLDLKNLKNLIQKIPQITEVSIGHALICDALYLGLETTIRRYRECL